MSDPIPSGARAHAHICVMGVSGSGKTSVAERVAEHLGRPYGEADDFHPEANKAKMAAGNPLNDDDRAPWLAAIRDWLNANEKSGTATVFSCSALKRKYRDFLGTAEGGVWFVYLDGSQDLISERLAAREGHFMKAQMLQSQFDALEPLHDDERGQSVDISGTVDEVVQLVLAGLPAPVVGGAR